jgi:twitching motility protein PilJ
MIMNSSTELKSSQPTTKAFTFFSSEKLKSIKKVVDNNLVPVLSLAAVASTAMVAISGWNTWDSYRKFQNLVQSNFRLQELSGQIIYLDEVLTMSSRMAASTGNLSKWQGRYNENVPKLDSAINEVISLAPGQEKDPETTKKANDLLVAMEEKAFKWISEGKKTQAFQLLLSPEYDQQKTLYSVGMNGTLLNIKESLDNQLKTYRHKLEQSTLLVQVSLVMLVISWGVVLYFVRSYINERNLAQSSLRQLNQDLEKRVEERTKQLAEKEQTTLKDNEILQEDVSQILDVVSALEEGNLTVTAPVSDRVTGLVSDTLNRLIEELSRVLSQVFYTTDQVNRGAKHLETMANTVVANTQQEVESVNQVLDLTTQVEQSALDSVKKIQATIVSLQLLSKAVKEGKEGIVELNQGINILQQGTEQIIQQMKTLGEFVGLTDHFVQEQSQISSMTQVLAMNASLVAARASEQRDPAQFVVVAREFESIANQVSNLAQRTSGGLASLEQRSSQIHNVVSSIDANVQNLGGLVKAFTQGVEQSNQVFVNVQKTADEAAQAGEMVARSSEGIVNATQSTAQVMGEITQLVEKTAQLTQHTKVQADKMEELSHQLFSRVEFFCLPGTLMKTIDSSESETTILQLEKV